MYVKLIDNSGETIFGCDSVAFPERGGCIVISVDGKPETLLFTPDMGDVQVYVMNNEGATIDGRAFWVGAHVGDPYTLGS